MKEENQAIERERYTMPTLQEFKVEVNGANFFNLKIHLKQPAWSHTWFYNSGYYT